MIKNYPIYKKSGIEWVGEIPSNWKISKVKYVSKNHDGKRIPLSGSERADKDGMYPYYGATGQVDSIDDYIFDGEYVLVGEDGAPFFDKTKQVAYRVKNKFWVNNHAHILSNKENYDLDYFYYVLNLVDYKEYISGSTRDKLTKGDLLNIPVLFPSLGEQTKIVEYLDHHTGLIEAIIEKKQLLIEKLKEQRQAIINEAVTKGLDPGAPMKDSGVEWLGEIPENWEVKPLKSVATYNDETLKDSTPEDQILKYVEIGGVSLEKGIEEIQKTSFKDAPSRARRIVRENDIIISTVRTYLKAIAKIEKEQDGFIASTGFAVIRPKAIIPEYLGLLIQAENFIDEIIANSVGVSYPAINASDLMQIKIPVPNKAEQLAISEKLENSNSKIFQSIGQIENSLEKLKRYRQSIISEAVTGKIDVREWEPQEKETA